jgi:hypothetical protein
MARRFTAVGNYELPFGKRPRAPILLSGQPARAGDPNPKPVPLIVAAELRLGKGALVFSQSKAAGRLSHEPVARGWFEAILKRR